MAPQKSQSNRCTSSKSNSSSETGGDKENEVTSPPLAQEKKVRKVRPSPFHKGSGVADTGAPSKVNGVAKTFSLFFIIYAYIRVCVRVDQVKAEVTTTSSAQAQGTRPRRQGTSQPKSYAVYYSDDDLDDSDDDEVKDIASPSFQRMRLY